MPKEIERRFLVTKIDPEIKTFDHRRIRQGYFETGPDFSLRVRIVNDATAFVTRKSGSGLEREEDELLTTDLSLAEFLMKGTACRLEKTRYYREGWEVDFFHGALEGLVIAEYEMLSVDQEVKLPSWISEAQEVTDSLTNQHLARLAYDLGELAKDRLPELIERKRLPRIVLTGGPCSGKSTMMKILREEFGDRIHCVPEVASIVIAQVGVKPPTDPHDRANFQRAICTVQRSFEGISETQARSDGKKALLLDRGTLDSAAYLPEGLDDFVRLMKTSVNHEMEQYDLIICLAVPPKEIYEAHQANNPARRETYDEARVLGKKIHAAWDCHDNIIFVGFPDWSKKVDSVRRLIHDLLESRQ